MIGIKAIGSYIPAKRVSNYLKKEKFEITDEFIKDKIGVEAVAVKEHEEESSDLCLKSFECLAAKTGMDKSSIECLVVVTQNPDYNIPHTSAIVHGKLDLPTACACFDISLGCSGFVYGLNIINSFMSANKMRNGILFTADPYSKIIDQDDKNTSLLFGDAASATWIGQDPVYEAVDTSFGTIGKSYAELICDDRILFMNGRAVSNFALKVLPEDIFGILARNHLTVDAIDRFVFHQGSKFIVEKLAERLNVPKEKAPYDIHSYGNTVSSTIPIILEKEMDCIQYQRLFLCGFGVGLSWANAILRRR